MSRGRILSGMQPTGKLHLGNLEGALRSWVRLQNEYEMFNCIVNWHALTTVFEDTSVLRSNVREVAIDYLSAGLDPERCAIFVQSHVKEHSELHLLLSMITPTSWLERVPTYKEKTDNLEIANPSYGLLGYPVLMAADILVYRADTVPVGKDQVPHLELTREIARRFNYLYGEVFPEPKAMLAEEAAVLPGLDGRKMSKSYGNTILMSEEPEEIQRKVKTMFTDPTKLYKGDPGHPETCPVYCYHKLYNPEEADQIAADCRSGALGCVADKKRMAEVLIKALEPLRDRRSELEQHPELLEEILHSGAEKARKVAQQTMEQVREAMKL